MELGFKTVRHAATVGALLLLLFGSAAVFGQLTGAEQADFLEGELRYVDGLQKLYLMDLADLVIANLEKKHPEARGALAVRKLKSELGTGQFDTVKKRIDEMSDQDGTEAWAMKLALADAYYTYNKYPEATGYYESFFKRFAKEVPPALQSFFTESAYKYAQMLLQINQLRPSLEAYQRVLSGKLERHVERQCLAEIADVALRLAKETPGAKEREALYKQVEGWADKLLWGQDIWFGKGIILKAHVAMLRGKPQDAKKLVDDYMPTLVTIHQSLVEQEAELGDPLVRISPMSECRYLLAAMLQDEAKRLMEQPSYDREAVLSLLVGTRSADGSRKGDGAFQHFINVFLKYPESTWAAEAGERSEQVRLVIEQVFGGTIKTVVTPELMTKVRSIQYRDARLLFAQGQIANAKERLLGVLNQFPDAPEAVPALGDLARCYMQELVDNPDEVILADTVIAHLSERFSGNSLTRGPAGEEVIRLAEYWLELGRADKRAAVYDGFFKNFPDHAMASSYMLSFGERHYQDKDYPAALSYFTQVLQTYSNTPAGLAALNRSASIYEETGDYTNQLVSIGTYIAMLESQPRPGQELMNARYRLAQASKNYGAALLAGSTNGADRALGNQYLGRAAVAYDVLAKQLDIPDHPYQANDDDKKANAKLHEAALYNMAYCLAQITEPEENVPAIRRRAIESYEALVARFPRSGYAPQSLIQVGALWTVMRDAAKAEAVLARLLKEYPESSEARSALPLIADNLMKLGMREEAIPRYRQMFSEAAGKYGDRDLLKAAQALTAAREFDLAQQGIDRVLARTQDKAVAAQARMAQARLLLERGKFTEAVGVLKGLVVEFSGSALVLDLNELLARAASEAGMAEEDDLKRKLLFNDAIDAVKMIRQYRTNIVEMAESDIQVGRVMARKARAETAFGKPEAASDSRGKALISYQGFIDTTDASNLALAPLVETAYFESTPLLLEHQRWLFAVENCQSYLQKFPRGRYLGQMRAWLNQAQIEMGAGQRRAAVPAPATAAAPAAPAATP